METTKSKTDVYVDLIQYHIQNQLLTPLRLPTVGDIMRCEKPLFEIFDSKTWIVQGEEGYQIIYVCESHWDVGFIKQDFALPLTIKSCNFVNKEIWNDDLFE